MVKPASWRIFQGIDKTYILDFTYIVDAESSEYAPVMTRRDTIKTYKTMNAVFNDIQKVQHNALIHYHATPAG